MMRVITGIARGRKLETLPGEDVTRPTTESVKEAVFSMIQFEIEDKMFLICLQVRASSVSKHFQGELKNAPLLKITSRLIMLLRIILSTVSLSRARE